MPSVPSYLQHTGNALLATVSMSYMDAFHVFLVLVNKLLDLCIVEYCLEVCVSLCAFILRIHIQQMSQFL